MGKNYILADNQDVTRAGLISYLKEIDIKATVSEVTSCNQLEESLLLYPNSVVIVDYSMFDFQSVNHMLNIKNGAMQSRWLLFSYEFEEHFLRQLLMLDNSISIVMKHNAKAQLIDALRNVMVGEVYWCDYADSVMSSDIPQTKLNESLTTSEKIILQQIALGKTTKEIAVAKNLSFHTVNAHRRNIYRKLGVNSANEATRYALQAGLIDLIEYYI